MSGPLLDADGNIVGMIIPLAPGRDVRTLPCVLPAEALLDFIAQDED